MRQIYYQIQYRFQLFTGETRSCIYKRKVGMDDEGCILVSDRFDEFDDAFAAYHNLKKEFEGGTIASKLLSAAIVKIQEDTVWTHKE